MRLLGGDKWTRTDAIALAGVLVATVAAIAAIPAVPGMPKVLHLDSEGEPKAHLTHWNGIILNPPKECSELSVRATIDAVSTGAKVDGRGNFDVPLDAAIGASVQIQVYCGDLVRYNHIQTLGGSGPLEIQLEAPAR